MTVVGGCCYGPPYASATLAPPWGYTEQLGILLTDTLNGHDAARVYRPITDPAAWIEALGSVDRTVLTTLGELFLGVTAVEPAELSAVAFTRLGLGGRGWAEQVSESHGLHGAARLTVPVAVAELITEHDPELGPYENTTPPSWTVTEIAEQSYRHPRHLRAAFPAGTLAPVPLVLQVTCERAYSDDPHVTIHARREDQEDARSVLAAILERAEQHNPYRGRVIRAMLVMGGLALEVITLPDTLSRETVVVDGSVWREIDLGIASVTTQREMLTSLGLGSRRGVLLVGPPGTGKSAVSAAVANEVVGDFTVVYVEAKAGGQLLTAVVEEAQRLGGPCLLVLEDLDLWCRQRSSGDSGLSELLQAMDIQSEAPILTLASTNDAGTLDKAAIRTGRFDSVVTVGYPDRDAAAAILATLTAGIPGGGDSIDVDTVASRLPAQTSGSDLREIVRRAVLSGGGSVSTAALLAEVGSGRYLATVPGGNGQYL